MDEINKDTIRGAGGLRDRRCSKEGARRIMQYSGKARVFLYISRVHYNSTWRACNSESLVEIEVRIRGQMIVVLSRLGSV